MVRVFLKRQELTNVEVLDFIKEHSVKNCVIWLKEQHIEQQSDKDISLPSDASYRWICKHLTQQSQAHNKNKTKKPCYTSN